MADRSKSREQADAAFKKAQKDDRNRDKSEAMQAYEANAEAAREKSARLKELRLQKEAEAREAEPASPRRKRATSKT